MPASLKCSTTQNYAGGEHGWGGNAGGTFRRWMAMGETDGAGVFYYLIEATSLGAGLMESASLKQAIRSRDARRQQARQLLSRSAIAAAPTT